MPRILHFGVGNFFRAHQAPEIAACPGWGVTGVSFRSTTIRDGLAAQGYRYTLLIKDVDGAQAQQISALDSMLVAPEDPGAVLAAVVDPAVEVISLTVTEKAYGLLPTGGLDVAAPEIAADLAGGPLCPVGALARGLAQRRTPVTVLSCDNLPDNGAKLRRAVADFAAALGASITCDVSFPASMVDRITPATTDAVRDETGDAMAVPTEAFTEWVVEDSFAGARPPWPNVQWVADVAPHEMRKLRMLNGAHSYLAYAGTLAGYTYVHEAVADPALRAGARALMAEAAQTLPAVLQGTTDPYADALLRRFDNPNLHHRLRQIAMDGSQKMPIRIVAPWRDRAGQSRPALDAAIAAWIDFVRAEVATGAPLDDPQADALRAACGHADPAAALREIIGA